MNHRLRSGQSRRDAVRRLGLIGALQREGGRERQTDDEKMSPPDEAADGTCTDGNSNAVHARRAAGQNP